MIAKPEIETFLDGSILICFIAGDDYVGSITSAGSRSLKDGFRWIRHISVVKEMKRWNSKSQEVS